MQPAQVDVSVWHKVLYVCVTGSHGNHEHGLVKIQEAPCFFKLNGYMYTYGCVCVCAYTLLTTSAALWTVGIQNSKLPPFLPDKNTPTFICFFYQPCLGAPSPLLGWKNKSFQTSKFKNTRQAQPWHGPLEVFWLFLPFVWGGFFWNIEVG